MSKREDIEKAVAALEQQRTLLGNDVTDAAIESLRRQMSEQETFIAERKWVTIMFADISGFTALSESKDPEEIRRLINRCLDYLVPVVHKYKGTIDKYIGDEIMALFGAPLANEQHAEYSCACALDMMTALQEFNSSESHNLGLHIGMNTGLVVAGGVGSGNDQQYSVMGDAVNLGARLKDKASNGQILVGQDTYQLTSSSFNFVLIPPMELKGKSKPVSAYSLKSKKELAPFHNKRHFGHTPLIGREKEINILNDCVNNLNLGKGSIISIVADAGIGKSRLVSEFRGRYKEQLHWVEGRSLSHLKLISFVPVQDLFRGLVDSWSEKISTNVENKIRKMILEQTSEQHWSDKALLTVLSGLEPDEKEQVFISRLDPASLRSRMCDAFISLIGNITSEKPLVIVWEDIHWADAESMELIEKLALQASTLPVCMILLFRPEKQDACWSMHERLQHSAGNYQTIELEAFDKREMEELVQNLMGTDFQTSEISGHIFNRTEGNPFYTEELLRSIRDQLPSTYDPDSILDLITTSLPQSFHSIVATRIDQLRPDDKSFLQKASIIGRIIDRDVLTRMMDTRLEESTDIDALIGSLIDREMIRKYDNGSDGKYIFRHAIVQEVAYNSLLLEQRKELHKCCGSAIENCYGEKESFLIAVHFEKSGYYDLALNKYLRAAELSAEAYAHADEVTARCKVADISLALFQSDPGPGNRTSLCKYLESAGDVSLKNLNLDKASHMFQLGLKHLPESSHFERGRFLRKNALSLETIATHKKAEILVLMEQAKQQLMDVEDRSPEWWAEWLDLQLDKAWALYWAAINEELTSFLESIRVEVFLHGLARHHVKFFQTEIMSDFRKYRYRLHDGTIQNAVKLFETITPELNFSMWVFTGLTKGFVYLWAERMNDAIAQFDRILPEVYRQGDKSNICRIFVYRMIAWRRKGNLEVVRQHLDEYFHSGNYPLQSDMYADYAHGCHLWCLWKEKKFNEMAHYFQGIKFHFKPDSPSPFNFLYAFPMAALCFSNADMEKGLAFLKEMMYPVQRELEPDLDKIIRKVLAAYDSDGSLPALETCAEIIGLGEQYRYL